MTTTTTHNTDYTDQGEFTRRAMDEIRDPNAQTQTWAQRVGGNTAKAPYRNWEEQVAAMRDGRVEVRQGPAFKGAA